MTDTTDRDDEDPHPAPIEIDLGMRHTFDVIPVVEALKADGCRVYLVDQSDIAKAAELHPKHCRLLVNPHDLDRVRAELILAGLL